MASDPPSTDLRSTLVGAAIAGVGAVVVMLALTAAELASTTVHAVIAIVLGVAAAQVYEHVLT